MKVQEFIDKIETGDVTWDNVYDIQLDDLEENKKLLEQYAKSKNIRQMSQKILMNSLK